MSKKLALIDPYEKTCKFHKLMDKMKSSAIGTLALFTFFGGSNSVHVLLIFLNPPLRCSPYPSHRSFKPPLLQWLVLFN